MFLSKKHLTLCHLNVWHQYPVHFTIKSAIGRLRLTYGYPQDNIFTSCLVNIHSSPCRIRISMWRLDFKNVNNLFISKRFKHCVKNYLALFGIVKILKTKSIKNTPF